MIIKNVRASLFSLKNISPSKYKSWTTRMWGVDSELQIISQQQEWNLLYAQCPWGWMKAGTRFNSTFPISQGEPMDQITLRPLEWLYTLTAGSGEYTFQIDSTVRRSCLPSLSCFCPFKNSNESVYIHRLSLFIQHSLRTLSDMTNV